MQPILIIIIIMCFHKNQLCVSLYFNFMVVQNDFDFVHIRHKKSFDHANIIFYTESLFSCFQLFHPPPPKYVVADNTCRRFLVYNFFITNMGQCQVNRYMQISFKILMLYIKHTHIDKSTWVCTYSLSYLSFGYFQIRLIHHMWYLVQKVIPLHFS